MRAWCVCVCVQCVCGAKPNILTDPLMPTESRMAAAHQVMLLATVLAFNAVTAHRPAMDDAIHDTPGARRAVRRARRASRRL